MIFINEKESLYKLWWKFIGSIAIFVVGAIALQSGTIYIPTKHGFIKATEDPVVFWAVLIIMFPLSLFSFYQGFIGLYLRSKRH